MCKGKQVCELLGTDPSKWSRIAPLPPEPWFAESLDHFAEAVALASHGALDASQERLRLTRGAEIRARYVEHGHVVGTARFHGLHPGNASDLHTAAPPDLDPLDRIPARLGALAWERDHYLCRYCEIPVVPKYVLNLYGELMGPDVFGRGRTNMDRHGIIMGFRANVDHVLPHKKGGRTDLENLVTSCWNCNYGKRSYTLRELGLDDPRDRPPQERTGWHGLTEHVHGMRQVRRALVSEGRLPARTSRATKPGLDQSPASFIGSDGEVVEGVLLSHSQNGYAIVRTAIGLRFLNPGRWSVTAP